MMAGWAIARLGIAFYDFYRRGAVRRKPGDILLILGLLTLITKTWGMELFKVSSSSMEPTLSPGEIFLAIKRPLWRGPIQVGQVVVLHQDGARISELVKRVAAVPGDHLVITEEEILVNNKPAWRPRSLVSIEEKQQAQAAPLILTIPEHSVFVLGDNSSNSVDSRFFGPIPDKDVYGKALLRIYPLSKWGWF